MKKGAYIMVALEAKVTEARPVPLRGGFAQLVTRQEMDGLRQALLKGEVPADLERKLQLLESRGVMHQVIAQHSRLFIMALIAAYAGSFKDISEHDRDKILRVLAYVRKDEDAIPDYTTGGFSDDLQEVRAVIAQLQGLLNQFKAWRLCHQVPRMWGN